MTNMLSFSLFVSLFLLFVIVVEGKVLRFREDGTFKITQFTDMHYGENDAFDIGSKIVQGNIIIIINIK